MNVIERILARFCKKYNFCIIFILMIILWCAVNWKKFSCHFSQQETDKFASLVLMSTQERDIIRSYLTKSHTMLEYGSGYSTLHFAQFVRAYYSIEHDRGWYNLTKTLINRSPSVSSIIKQYVLIPVDPGYKGWLGGFAEGNRKQFHDYIRAVHSLNVSKFDIVLIDGRARVECALEIRPFIRKDSIVFVHDYTHRTYYKDISRQYYRLILQTYEGQTLAAFKPR
jgi:hypothetical protein